MKHIIPLLVKYSTFNLFYVGSIYLYHKNNLMNNKDVVFTK